MEFRNSHPAFDGEFVMKPCGEHELHIVRTCGEHRAELLVDLENVTFTIRYTENGIMKVLDR